MYSLDWFDTFAATVPGRLIETELEGIARILPLGSFPRILDVGCGIGRMAGPLAARGYSVTGLDINVDALAAARQRAPGPRYVALDQRHVGRLRWTFDAALVVWHSLGFAGRAADLETLAGLAGVLRPGGRLAIDLFHPVWLQENERVGSADPRGAASVRRWVQDGRCCHEIEYPNGRVDRIAFDLYQPEEIRDIVRQFGLEPGAPMTWWDPARPAASDCARYQVVCEKRATTGK